MTHHPSQAAPQAAFLAYSARLRFLLTSLVILLVVYPFFEGVLLLNGALSFVLLTILLTISSSSRHRRIGFGLGIPYLITLWLFTIGWDHVVMAMLSRGLGVLFLGYATLALLRHVMRAERVDADVLYGAVSIYLLLGIIWALIYGSIEALQPGSFAMNTAPTEDAAKAWKDLVYYSFVTLTTLGYGDVAPVSSGARSLAVLEAITGVLFVAILVAQLVGLHIAQRLSLSSPPTP